MGNTWSFFADAKTGCLDTASEGSSVDTGSEHVFPNTESTNANTEQVNGNPTLDTDNLDKLDSLTRAEVDRENQGPWEAEYSYEGEADLNEQYKRCKKNRGHKNYILLDKFSIDDLPEGYRDPDMVDYVRALADMTVRVSVNYVSDGRPATVPGSGKPYLGYKYRGQTRMTVGTGWIDKVFMNIDYDRRTCKCKDCRNSSTPETQFAVIYITTAKHVVFDDLEAEHTTCHLFFDSGDTPDACSGVVTLTGMKFSHCDFDTDRGYIEHFTHDLPLGYRLEAASNKQYDLMFKLHGILPKITQVKSSKVDASKQPLLLIVSHPHGHSKHISIARWTSLSYDKIRDYIYEYTAATCPGSSGGLVVMPHDCSITILPRNYIYVPGTHCGTFGGVNFFTGYDAVDAINCLFHYEDYKKRMNTSSWDKALKDKFQTMLRNEEYKKRMNTFSQSRDEDDETLALFKESKRLYPIV